MSKKTKKNIDKGAAKAADQVVETTPVAAKAAETAARDIFASKSRRNTIIALVQENVWDTGSLANMLISFGYPDVKANKKAVAGTLYDMAQNKGWDVRKCDNDRIFIIV